MTTDLGYSESESYGVSYKARGLCKTLENVDIFDDDQVNLSLFRFGIDAVLLANPALVRPALAATSKSPMHP